MIGYKDIYKADCLAYIPPVYSDILEFKALAKCFNLELERTGTRLEEVENNFFIDSLKLPLFINTASIHTEYFICTLLSFTKILSCIPCFSRLQMK